MCEAKQWLHSSLDHCQRNLSCRFFQGARSCRSLQHGKAHVLLAIQGCRFFRNVSPCDWFSVGLLAHGFHDSFLRDAAALLRHIVCVCSADVLHDVALIETEEQVNALCRTCTGRSPFATTAQYGSIDRRETILRTTCSDCVTKYANATV